MQKMGQIIDSEKYSLCCRLYLAHFIVRYTYKELLAFDCKLCESVLSPEKRNKIRDEVFGNEYDRSMHPVGSITFDQFLDEQSEARLEKYYMALSDMDYYSLSQFRTEFQMIKATFDPEMLQQLGVEEE